MLTTNARVLVDWDGDGMFNLGVPTGTPDNLVPDPFLAQPSFVFGTTITGHEEPTISPEIMLEESAEGAQYNKVPCGGSNAKQVWLGYKWRYCQPLVGDTLSISGATENKWHTTPYWENITNGDDPAIGIQIVNSVYGRVAYGVNGAMGYDATTNYGQNPSVAVVTGQTYRLNFYTKVVRMDGSDPTGAFNFKVYGAGVTNGNLISTSNFTQLTTAGWTKRSITFTVPANNSFVYFVMEHPSITAIRVMATGFGIFATGTNPSYVADPVLTVAENQFSVVCNASTTYNLSFFVKADSFNSIGLMIKSVDIGTVTWSALVAETNYTVSGSWVRVSASFTTGANECGVVAQIIPYVGASPASAGVTGNIYLKGFQVTEGTQLYPFHAGATSAYDNITDWVKSVNWKMGKKSIEEPMPYEGTMQLTLNNQDKMFSPKNTASPLYGYFNQNRKVVIQIQNPSTKVWVNRWSGWLSSFEATAGLSQTLDAVILCSQGIFRFREGDYTAPVETLKRLDEIVENVLKNGAWRSTATALEGVLGFNMRVGVNAYINNFDATVNQLEAGLNTYAIQGSGWGVKTTTDAALNDVLSAENAGLWIDREGKLNIVNRNHWVNGSAFYDVLLTADTQVQSADYNYGKDIINKYEVQIVSPSIDASAVIWQTKYARPVKNNGSTKIAMVFTFPEGMVKTVTNVEQATTFSVYTRDPALYTTDVAVTDAAILANISVTATKGSSNRFYLVVRNNNNFAVWIQASVSGNALATSNESTAIYVDTDSIRITQSTHKANKTNPLIMDEGQALAVAQFYVGRNSLPIGEFDQLKIIDKGTQATHDLIESLKLGAILKIRESQTAETGLIGTIVEEAGSISNGTFSYTVILSKLESQNYFQIDGVQTLEPSNAAVSAYPIALHGAKVADKVVIGAAVKEFSTSKFDGTLYFIDHPSTVRTFPIKEVNVQYDTSLWSVPAYWVFNENGTTIARINTGFKNVLQGTYKDGASKADVPVVGGDCYQLMAGGWMSSFGLGGSSMSVQDGWQDVLATGISDVNWAIGSYGAPTELKNWNYNAGVPQKSYAPATVNTLYGLSDETWGLGRKFVAEKSSNGVPVSGVLLMVRQLSGGASWRQQYNGNYFDNSNPMIAGIALVNCSNLKNMPVDSSKSYKFALWARTADESDNVSYTLELLNRYHVVVASQAFTPNKTGITRVEATLPSGNGWVTARLHKTSGNTEQRNDKLWIYGWSLTEDSLTNYTDIPAPQSLVYI